jgi:hypothetical protein
VIEFLTITNSQSDALQLLPEFRRLKEFIRRTEHNLERRFDRLVFDSKPIFRHEDPFIYRILGRINEASLTQYRVFEGRAERLKYEGDLLEKQKTVSSSVFLLRNQTDGISLKFRVYERNYGLLVHILFIERDSDLQGNFFTIKRTVVEEMWSTILEPAGAAVLAGTAMFSINSQVKRPCAAKDDWRNSLNYIGLDQDLRPIFVSGIMRFYLMMNFLPFGIIERAEENKVALISESVSEKIRQRDPEAWDEAQKYTSDKRKEWHEVVKQRESLLSVEELERRKRISAARFREQILNN